MRDEWMKTREGKKKKIRQTTLSVLLTVPVCLSVCLSVPTTPYHHTTLFSSYNHTIVNHIIKYINIINNNSSY